MSSLATLTKPDLAPDRSSATGFCEQKYRLLDQFLEAVHELGTLQAAQTRSVIRGEPDFLRFDLALYHALEKKDKAKYAWIAHVEEHGCHEGGYERWD